MMSQTKLAVIGAGSFVFGPSVLSEAILTHRLGSLHLALMDVDRETLELMAGVGRRMARETGVDMQITTHTERESALDGADFVVCTAAPQMQKRHAIDCEIIETYLPGHQITEFGGISGISYSLRQIALVEQITSDMKRLCPNAWLLSVSNPLPRVCQAAHEFGIRTAGFCSVSLAGYGSLARLLSDRSAHYPFAEPRAMWDATMAGVNHLSWLIALRDRKTGQDVYPELRSRLEAGATAGNPRSEQIARETGYLLMPGDDHVKDFLKPIRLEPPHPTYHGTSDERQRRLNLMRSVAEGDESWDALLDHPAWEKPVDLVAALAYGTTTELPSLNLLNEGQIPQLPRNIFVETPCTATSGTVTPMQVSLPDPVLSYCVATAEVTDTLVRAARERSRALVHEAVERDPTVLDTPAGILAIDACLAAHADLLPTYL